MAKKSHSIGIDSARDWQAESDLSTLIAAETIKKDPKRLKAAQDVAHQRLTEVAAIAGQAPADAKS